jgi:hypothetical protein
MNILLILEWYEDAWESLPAASLFLCFALLDNSELVCVNGRSFEYYKCSWFWYYATYIAITGGTIEHLLQKKGYPNNLYGCGIFLFFSISLIQIITISRMSCSVNKPS